MTSLSFQAFTDAGCLVIFDPAAGFQATDEWLGCLNHVSDPDGRTALTCDYPRGEWPAVWRKNVCRLRELGNQGEFTLLLCAQVEYACRISDDITPPETERLQASFEEWIHAPSGRLVFGDAMAAFSGMAMEDESFAEVSVTPGWNKVRIHSLAAPADSDHMEGFDGTEDFPALVFSIEPVDTRPAAEREDEPFPRVPNHHLRAAGDLCHATVIGVDDGVAKLRLHRSKSITSGHGRLTLTEAADISPGDSLLVRLIEERKAFWLAEIP